MVPIFTEATESDGIFAFAITASMASSTPSWISEVVGVLCQARTFSFCRMTLGKNQFEFRANQPGISNLSVFVPPTSMPITQFGSFGGITGSRGSWAIIWSEA